MDEKPTAWSGISLASSECGWTEFKKKNFVRKIHHKYAKVSKIRNIIPIWLFCKVTLS